MSKYLIVFIGGGAGSCLRYLTANLNHKYFNTSFPLATFFVNISGSFLIGLFWAVSEKWDLSPNLRFFIFTGLLGGYTTFSTFSIETLNLLRNNEYKIAAINVFLSFFAGLFLAYAGFLIGKKALTI